MFAVNGNLHVVTGGDLAVFAQQPCLRVDRRNLAVRRLFQPRLQDFLFGLFFLETGDFPGERLVVHQAPYARLVVRRVLLGQRLLVIVYFLLQGVQLVGQLFGRVNAVGGRVALEKAAVDGDLLATVEADLLAQQDEVLVSRLQCRAVVLAEVGEGLVAWPQTLGQPDHFQVAYRLTLQPTAGMDAVQVAVKVQLQQCARRKRLLPRMAARSCVLEAQGVEAQGLDIGVDGPDGVAPGNVFVNAGRQEHRLLAAKVDFVWAHIVLSLSSRGYWLILYFLGLWVWDGFFYSFVRITYLTDN